LERGGKEKKKGGASEVCTGGGTRKAKGNQSADASVPRKGTEKGRNKRKVTGGVVYTMGRQQRGCRQEPGERGGGLQEAKAHRGQEKKGVGGWEEGRAETNGGFETKMEGTSAIEKTDEKSPQVGRKRLQKTTKGKKNRGGLGGSKKKSGGSRPGAQEENFQRKSSPTRRQKGTTKSTLEAQQKGEVWPLKKNKGKEKHLEE